MKTTYASHIFLFTFIILLSSFHKTFAQWVQTQGPSGITVLRFYDSGTYLYAGTDSKGAWRSDDNGTSWNAANGNIPNLTVFSFAQDASYLYAGSDSGVYRSSDNGLTWSPANAGIQSNFANCLLLADGYLFMGTVGAGMFRSADHGDTWQDANGGALNFGYITAMCYAGGKLIAQDDNLLFYSTDDGNSWNYDTGPEQYYNISDFYTSGDTVMAAAGNVSFVTFDALGSWTGPHTIDANYTKITGIARTGNTFYAGGMNGVYSSTDFGSSWSHITPVGLRIHPNNAFGQPFQYDFIRSGSNFLLAYEELGIYASADGVTWNESKNGFPPASSIDNCMISAGNDIWTGTHTNGVFVTADGGDTWSRSGAANIATDTLPNSIIKSMLYAGNNLLFAGGCGNGNGLWRSADYGGTWTHITNGLSPGFGTSFCVNSLGKSGNILIACAGSDGVYYSTDNGLTWQPCIGVGSNNYVEGIAVHDSVVCISVSAFYGNGGVYRSTDNGIHFSFTDGSVLDGASMDADNAGNFYAGSLSDVYRSTDDGVTWSVAENGIPYQSGGFAVKAVGQNVFVGNSSGIFFSSDYGASFTAASDGLDAKPNNSTQGFTVHQNYIYAGLFRNAIWKRPLSDFGIATQVSDFPSSIQNSFEIISSSPQNIFYQVTLSTAADVQLQLIDVMGRTVESFDAGNMSGGVHTGSLDTHHLANGIYFVQLTAGNFVKAQKWVKGD